MKGSNHFDDWPVIKSDLAVAVYDAVYAAGMTFPFPQREVRLLGDQEGGTTRAGVKSVNETYIGAMMRPFRYKTMKEGV